MNLIRLSISPQMAAEWLKYNDHNRPVKDTVVKRYAELMKNGRWQLNGESIIVSDTGKLLDGQHRLLACVQSGATFESVVVQGVPEDAFGTLDQGLIRSHADLFSITGEEYPKAIAACAGVLIRYQTKNWHSSNFARVSFVEKKEVVDRNPGLRFCAQKAHNSKASSFVPSSVLGAAFYLFWSIDQDDACEFLSRLADGAGLSSGNPILAVRERIISSRSKNIRLSPQELLALLIKAWNKYRTNEPTKIIRWLKDEEFPQPV